MHKGSTEGIKGRGDSSSSDDERGDRYEAGKRKQKTKKKHIQGLKFVIHPNDLGPTENQLSNARKGNTTTILLDDSKTEREIREELVEKLPQLVGKSFKFFTRGKNGRIFCPCSPIHPYLCKDKEHAKAPVAEWNAKRIKRMVGGNKVVYIHCQDTCSKERNGEELLIPTVTMIGTDSENPNRATFCGDESHMIQPPVGEEDLPDLAIGGSSLHDEEVSRLLGNVSFHDQKVMDTSGATLARDKYTRMSTGIRTTPLNTIFDSAYQSGSTTSIFAGGMDTDHRNERANPLTPSPGMGNLWREPRTELFKITEITPSFGSVEGGYNFLITVDTSLVYMNHVRVMFGDILADSVKITGDKDQVKGKVPPSPIPGVVEVKLLHSIFEETISCPVPFEYIEEKDTNKELTQKCKKFVDEEISTPQQCRVMASVLFEKMSQMQLSSAGATSGNTKTRALDLLHTIVESAARVNAMDLFTIIFNTSVGPIMFKTFRNGESPLEEIARHNGHEELACYLEQKHSMYRECESDSDDEVDWLSLAKAARNYQGRTVESTGSSDDCADYDGDVECSLLSESEQIIETFLEEPLEEREQPPNFHCQDDSQEEERTSEDLSSLPDEDTIRETVLKEKESFEAGEADGRKEDCSEVHQSAIITENYEDLIHESGHFKPEFPKSNKQNVSWLGLFVKKLKFLRRLDLLTRLLHDMKETMKKAKKSVPTSCVNKKLLATKLSVDEQEIPSSLIEFIYPESAQFVEKEMQHDTDFSICHISSPCPLDPYTKTGEAKMCSSSLVTEDVERPLYGLIETRAAKASSGSFGIDVEPPADQPLFDELTKTRKAKRFRRRILPLVLVLALLIPACGLVPVLHFAQTEQTSEGNVTWQKSPRSFEVVRSTAIVLRGTVNSSLPASTAKPLNFSSTTERNFSRPVCKLETISNCLRSCPKDKIEVINQETVENDCWPCDSCHPGHEPSVYCGSIVNKGAFIGCDECKTGTFSSSYNRLPCRKCSQCKLNETVVRPCRPSADTVCASCEPDQNTWIDTKKEEYGCFDCPVCSSGFEPSHPCGSVVPYGEIITCVQCQEGKTFSTMRNKRQCKKCSSCPGGQRIIARCTKLSDTICGGPCGHDKIILLAESNNPHNVSCIDCLLCPEGMEPSVDCGETVPYGRDVLCVPCKPGLTYSDRYGPHKCKRCTTCSPGSVLISRCSIHHNTVCGGRCLLNQITFSNKSSSVCVNCIKCSVGMEPSIPCGAVVDNWPHQRCIPCKVGTFSSTYGSEPCKLCSICDDRSVTKICTKTSNTACGPCKENYYFDPFVFECLPCSLCCNSWNNEYPRECNLTTWRNCQARRCSSTSKYLPTTALLVSTKHRLFREMSKFPRSMNSFKSKAKFHYSPSPGSGKSTSLNEDLFLTSILAAVCAASLLLIVSVIVLKFVRRRFKAVLTSDPRMKRRLRKFKREITLEELDEKHMGMFEWMCNKLDNGRWCFSRDYERLAARFDRITKQQRVSLQHEALCGGSPSHRLMSLLLNLYPSLPLRSLVHSLRKIGRNDIAKKLTDQFLDGNYGASRLIEESCVEDSFLHLRCYLDSEMKNDYAEIV